jgi:integrase
MGRGPHLCRRGAVYYWQRRVPTHLARRLRISHVKVNLRTKDVAIARRLVAPLDARAMEVFMDHTQQLSREQLGNIFKTVLAEHQAKLSLLADIERAKPSAERRVLREEELAQGVAYTLLAQQGADAHLPPMEQQKLRNEGFSVAFLVKIIQHLERLRDEQGIKISRQRLAHHVHSAGGAINAVNLTRAQPVYLRALGAALLAADRRYGERLVDELDFDALIKEVGNTAGDLKSIDAVFPSKLADPSLSLIEPLSPVPQEMAPPITPAKEGSSIAFVAAEFEKKRGQDGEWDNKTSRQARFIFALFARFMREVHEVDDFCSVRQPHLAEFDGFLRELHANFGKSTRDTTRSIEEIKALAAKEAPKHGVLQGATRNRHLTFLGQLVPYARSGRGLAIDPGLTTTPFRARKNKRGRDQRTVPDKAAVEALFHRPVFNGYSSWDDINTPGLEFYHRAEYFCTILAAYIGARREEYCGLAVDDVITNNGEIPYIHIAPNAFRRIKNLQSVRNLALHPELVRLGFLNYVDQINALGYRRLFPDLYSPSTRSPLGDRLYDQLLPSLRAVGFTPHQVRHFFGDELKQGEVSKEFRADLLGHGGESETTERYCNPLSVARQIPHLMKLPIVTAHLTSRPIKLLSWIVEKQIAPWSKAAKRAQRPR